MRPELSLFYAGAHDGAVMMACAGDGTGEGLNGTPAVSGISSVIAFASELSSNGFMIMLPSSQMSCI